MFARVQPIHADVNCCVVKWIWRFSNKTTQDTTGNYIQINAARFWFCFQKDANEFIYIQLDAEILTSVILKSVKCIQQTAWGLCQCWMKFSNNILNTSQRAKMERPGPKSPPKLRIGMGKSVDKLTIIVVDYTNLMRQVQLLLWISYKKLAYTEIKKRKWAHKSLACVNLCTLGLKQPLVCFNKFEIEHTLGGKTDLHVLLLDVKKKKTLLVFILLLLFYYY